MLMVDEACDGRLRCCCCCCCCDAAAGPEREICAIVGAAPDPRSRDWTLCNPATFVVGVCETRSSRASCWMRAMRSGGAG